MRRLYVVVGVLLAGSAVAANAESPSPVARSTAGPSVLDGRILHTATLLSDGRVLVTGGTAEPLGLPAVDPLASAALYDLTSGVVSPTAAMSTTRIGHTATLLADGRVLIIGGAQDGSVDCCASAELYDPGTGTFAPAGAMTARRTGHAATRLDDGRVLVVGGEDGRSSWTAELYDPVTGVFMPTGVPVVAHGYGHSATLLRDGRVLIVGGSDALASAEVYDPVTGSFEATGGPKNPRQGHSATLLPDGRVVITGGMSGVGLPVFSGDPGIAAIEIHDPRWGVFSPDGTLPEARSGQSASLLPDGRVLVAGGWLKRPSDGVFRLVSAGALFDPADGTIAVTGPLARSRGLHTATPLVDGRVLLIGGIAEPPVLAETYDPISNDFTLWVEVAPPA